MENLVSILKEFIKSKQDNVFLLKGDWGIGKTYFWNKHENQLKCTNDDYRYYSMMSLYGKRETSEIYREIILNTEMIYEEDKSISLFDKAKSLGKKASNFISKSPYVKEFVGDILVDYTISKINDSIIVLDDFERINTDSDKEISNQFDEVFGLVNDLKEKGNKIIIISNIEDKYDDLRDHIEKNVDIEFFYDPKINTIIGNIFDLESYTKFIQTIEKIANEIELKNMRAVKKLQRNVDFLLNRTSETTVNELLSDLTLYTLCKYSQTNKIPSYQSLIESSQHLLFRHEEIDEENKEAFRLANKYVTIYNHEVKDKILRLIDYGYLEKSETDFLKDHIEGNVESRERYQLFNDAWDYFHNNFENDTNKFIELLYTGCKENLDQIEPKNFENAVKCLSELGEEDKSQELIKEYFEVNVEKFREVLAKNPHGLPMSYEVKSDEMNRRLNLIKDENNEIRPIMEIVKKVTFANSWGRRDVTELASHSIADYEQFIKETESEDLTSYIQRLFEFGNSSGDDNQKIKKKTIKALEKICQDGGLNKYRINKKFDLDC